MQLYARYVTSQAAWANAICLHMLIGISENQNFRIACSETLTAPLSLHKLAIGHGNISSNTLVRTQLFFPIPIYETPVSDQTKGAGHCAWRAAILLQSGL